MYEERYTRQVYFRSNFILICFRISNDFSLALFMIYGLSQILIRFKFLLFFKGLIQVPECIIVIHIHVHILII